MPAKKYRGIFQTCRKDSVTSFKSAGKMIMWHLSKMPAILTSGISESA
jgi:hypothetical protein